jgi:hypothetical protein
MESKIQTPFVERHTHESLSLAVTSSVSVSGVLRFLGLRPGGGTHAYISKKIKLLSLDTSHFTGMTTNSGKNHKGGYEKKPSSLVLVKRCTGKRQSAVRLRRALVESGVEYKCSCGQDGIWLNKLLILQVEHKNRDWLDDRRENLEFLCPNCHSQTPGWSGNKGGTDAFSSAKQHRNRRALKRKARDLVG